MTEQLLAPMPESSLRALVDEYRARVDDLTISEIARALAAYAVNLAQHGDPAGFELAHILALAQRAGVDVDVVQVRERWATARKARVLPATPAAVVVARPGGFLARLRGLTCWPWS